MTSTSKNKKSPEKKFDCVAMKHAAQAKLRKETKGMTDEQWVAYIERRVLESPFGDLFREMRAETIKRKAAEKNSRRRAAS